MKKLYELNIIGCDDTTTFMVEIDERELEVVKMICDKSESTSQYGCQPVMKVSEVLNPTP
jgi:hypothetical protein